LQRYRRGDYGNAFVLVQIEEIFITRDDEIGAGGGSPREDVIIVRIAANWG